MHKMTNCTASTNLCASIMGATVANSFWEASQSALVLRYDVVPLCWDTWFGFNHIKKNSIHLEPRKQFRSRRKSCRNFADVLAGCGRRFFHLCYDNFFNSIKLVTTFKEKLVKATSTICDNRSEKCPLVVNNILKKQERGNFNFKTDTKNGYFT